MRTRVLAALALIPWSLPAMAEEYDPDEVDYTRSGMYAGLSAGYVWDSADERFGDTYSIAGFVGARYLTYVATELQLEGYGDVKGPAITLNFKGYLPLGRLQPFLIAGVGPWNFDQNGGGHDWGGQLRGGGGVEYWFRPQLAASFTMEYLAGTGNLDGEDGVDFRAGAIYRF